MTPPPAGEQAARGCIFTLLFKADGMAVFLLTKKNRPCRGTVLLRVCSFRHVLPSCFFLSDDAAELAYDEHYQQDQVEEAHQLDSFAAHVFRLPFSSRPACRPWRNSCGCTNR